MELFPIFSCCIFVILSIKQGVDGFNMYPSISAEKAVFGNNTFTLTCQYEVNSNENFYFIQLVRQRTGFAIEENIILFQEGLNATVQDSSLKPRTTLMSPTATSRTITVQFNDIICSDRASYMWKASYFDGSQATDMIKSVTMIVQAITTFVENVPPSFTPNSSLKAGDDVTFTCSGDVGAEPRGDMRWFYFLNSSNTGGVDISSQMTAGTPVFSDQSCSWTQTSSVVLAMTRQFNGIVVRCEVQQEQVKRSKQTVDIKVQYGPNTPQIVKDPNAPIYYKGDASLNLTCFAQSNPSADYYWVIPNGNSTMMVDGPVYQITDLEEADTGSYLCVAYNTINTVNYTMNSSASIEVRMTTTTSTTTSTTPSSTEANNTGNPGPSSGGDEDGGGTDIGMIVGIIVGVVVLVIIIVVVVLCVKKRSRKPEIEEPPEKPRNNQDLTFYGNRPDLVTSELKNNQHNLNTSFSNSYDSSSDIKSNQDGLNYIDLQFDDKPRSRRPIQLIDNGGTPYADISLPQV